MILSIHQPDYIPWIGFFYKVSRSDCLVYLDDVQFSNQAAHNFNYIKTAQDPFRLKIPVDYHFGDTINQVRTKDELSWKQKHLKTLEYNYSKAPFFKETFPEFENILNRHYCDISEFNIAMNNMILKGFNISTKLERSSNLNIKTKREQKVIDICLKMGSNTYLSGQGAKAYQIKENFNKNGIELLYLDYDPIKYAQIGKPFLPKLSVIDFIFNCGFDWAYIEKEIRGY